VKKIEQVASRVKKAKFLSEKIEEDQTALLLRRAGEICKEARFLKMSEVAPIIRRHVDIKPDKWYPELGIRSFGRGTFHKVAIKGSDVGKKPLFHIEVGDLLISQVFAWEGAIAVVQPENKGRFGSHRFITCLPDPNLATAEFLCYYFLTDSGLKDLRKASTGAAGRNKPLGFTRLPNIKVPIPPIEIQKNFSQLVNYIKNVKQIHRQVVIGLGHVIPALLDQAFGGEL
jgi:type I restriction enzyme S subunit